jgi:ceramide glucosyltransferase
MPIAADLARWTIYLLLTGAVVGCLYLATAGLLVLRHRRHGPSEASPVPVTVLVPLCGDEPRLAHLLRDLCDQDYAAPVQIVCGARSVTDPALAIARQIAADDPQRRIEVHVDPEIYGRNLKVSNQINMARHARHDTLIMVDSDIEISRHFLSGMVAELQKPGVGAVSCLYHGVAADGVWARLAASRINTHFLPNVIVALSFGLARPCFGAGMAISRDTLQRIGDLESYADELWEDYAMGEAVRALGLEVGIPRFTIGHVYADGSAHTLVTSQIRDARTIRGINPVGHAGSVVTHPFPLALTALLIGGGNEALVLALIALGCRSAVGWCVEYRFGARPALFWLMPLRDALSFVVLVASFFGGRVTWRGQRYRLYNRKLIPDPG